MDPITAKLMSAAGAAAEERIYVDDLFSTFVYDGTGADQSIVNGIDLSGEGGMVWIKSRDQARDWNAFDTERGVKKRLMQNSPVAESFEEIGSLSAFNSNGFTVGDRNDVGVNNEAYCSWTFRKCPGFFDVVTYTGDGTNGRAISHNLGHNIRALFIKSTSGSGDWAGAYLNGVSLWTGDSYTGMYLNKSDGRGASTANGLGVSAISTTTFTVNASGSGTQLEFVPNANGVTYVAYLFSDQAAFGDDGDEKALEVGTYTGTGAAGKVVNVGFEPQWVLIKYFGSGYAWGVFDNMRGIVDGRNDPYLMVNLDSAEDTGFNGLKLTSTGFELETGQTFLNALGGSYWYMAIRRPNKPPETAAKCFDVFTQTGSSSDQLRPGTAGSSVTDMAIIKNRGAAVDWVLGARLLGNNNLFTNSTAAETTARFGTSLNVWDHMSGTFLDAPTIGINNSSYNYVNYHFARKPGFFDVVTYTGNGNNGHNINHNLTVSPEMIIVKGRENPGGFSPSWAVWHKDSSNGSNGANSLILNTDASLADAGHFQNNGGATATQFGVNQYGVTNNNGTNFIALLFASLDGISKVGSYTGTGSAQNIDCGFTNGARFVLIKRTDSSGHWISFDTARGINSGSDPILFLNLDIAEVTGNDRVDPLNSGFAIANTDQTDINASNGTYIFLAIA